MSKLVVDASVAAKWLVKESLSDKALDVLGSSDELYAPDLLLAEVGNILWKYDSLYLALAEAEGCEFVTADERLVNAVAHTPIAARAKWLGAR